MKTKRREEVQVEAVMENDYFQLSRDSMAAKGALLFRRTVRRESRERGKFNGHEFTKTRDHVSARTVSFGNDSFSWSWRWCKRDSRQKELRRYDLPVKRERTPRCDFESMDPFKVSLCEACSAWLSVGNATNDS